MYFVFNWILMFASLHRTLPYDSWISSKFVHMCKRDSWDSSCSDPALWNPNVGDNIWTFCLMLTLNHLACCSLHAPKQKTFLFRRQLLFEKHFFLSLILVIWVLAVNQNFLKEVKKKKITFPVPSILVNTCPWRREKRHDYITGERDGERRKFPQRWACSRIVEWRGRLQINILNAKIGPPGVWQIFHTVQSVEMEIQVSCG